MTDIFLYGTLRHTPLLERVLGRSVDPDEVAPDVLDDHEVKPSALGPFPVIVSEMGCEAPGIVLKNPSENDLARLDFYESGYEYTLFRQTTRAGRDVKVYFPPAHPPVQQGAWDLTEWLRDWSAICCVAAEEIMSFLGQRSGADIVRMFPMIQARATSKIQAQEAKHGAGTLRGSVDIHSRTRVYTDFFALDDFALRHERFDGTMSGSMDRAILVATDAAIVLPYDPVRDTVLMVEQFRMGPLGRTDPNVWQLEPIAGRVDAGETPEHCARREALEEAGLEIQKLIPIAEVYPSPGTSTEFYYIYVGLADLPDGVEGLGGLETEQEDIRSHVMPLDDLLAMVDALQAANAPLVLCANWLARHRDRLRDTP